MPLPTLFRSAGLALLLGAAALAGPAHAFTIENKDASPYQTPEFNLEEQSRQFRSDANGGKAGKYEFDGAFGKGTLEFGTSTRPYYGSGFGSSGYGPTRRDFDRVTAPPSSLDYNR